MSSERPNDDHLAEPENDALNADEIVPAGTEVTAEATDETPDADSSEQQEAPIPPWPTEQFGPEWRMWPPSAKMQIVLIAVAFGIFNCVLIGIWAVVMVNNA